MYMANINKNMVSAISKDVCLFLIITCTCVKIVKWSEEYIFFKVLQESVKYSHFLLHSK